MTVSFTRNLTFDGTIAYVSLTRGYRSIIDAADASLVDRWNWASLVSRGTVYGRRNRLIGDGRGPSCILIHRVLTEAPDGADVDHINGDGLDNRRCNLRIVSHADNMKNTRLRSDNTSGLKGAFWDKFTGKWMAAIGYRGKFKNLGRFDTAQQAHAAYAKAAGELFGEFARMS